MSVLRSPNKDKAQSVPNVVWDLENIMTFVVHGFSFILHLVPVCQGLFVNILLLNRYFYSLPIGWCHLQIVTC